MPTLRRNVTEVQNMQAYLASQSRETFHFLFLCRDLQLSEPPQSRRIWGFAVSASALVKLHVVFCCHGYKHVHPDFTLESMEGENALSYYSYRMTSVTERVKNLSIVWNYRSILQKNVHLFYKLFPGSCSYCLKRI